MEELARRDGTEMAILDDLSRQARYYVENIALNMIQLGRVFAEAKKLVKHGEWGAWLRENTGISERYAQQYMQAYARFGENPAIAQVGDKSKILKLLALPEGTEEQFVAENDVSAMTCREVDDAVRLVREQMEAEIARERKARLEAENRAKAAENEPRPIPDVISSELRAKDELIARQQEELSRARDEGNGSLEELRKLRRDNAELRRDLEESADMLEETQKECNRAQAELLDAQSMIAKGDAERIPANELTTEAFAAAVREFVGTCARFPHMRKAFSMMDAAERDAYDELLCTVEGWAKDARDALDTILCEEVVIHG